MSKYFILCLTLLLSGASFAEPKSPIKALYITEIGNRYHNYEKQGRLLQTRLPELLNIDLTLVGKTQKETLKVLGDRGFADGYDLILYNACLADSEDNEAVANVIRQVEEFHKPIVFLHCAMHNFRYTSVEKSKDSGEDLAEARASWSNQYPGAEFPIWSNLTGIDSAHHELPGPIWVTKTEVSHPITQTLRANWFTPWDELYVAANVASDVIPLYTGDRWFVKPQIVAWARDSKGGRIFGTTLGHGDRTLENKDYEALLQRGILWTVDGLSAEGEIKPGFESRLKAADSN